RVNLPSHVRTAIQTSERKGIEKKIKEGDKMADRATAENVLDKHTIMMLYKFRNNGTLDSINGCVSTGKEANVYHATAGEAFEGNVIHSIYKTSALLFRDRDRYVSGDRRFKHGYCKTNPRKMVSVWAEKELRNLKRLENVGIRVPKVIALKKHILIMEFIGKNGWCAPRLKDAKIAPSKLKDVYLDIIKTMWTMYHKAKLIHADLSEYNMLYYNGYVYYIDVSQSVELDHPHGLEFLRKDCENIKNYFIRNGLTFKEILTTKELFDFITDVNITEDIVDIYLSKMFEKIQSRPIALNEEEKVQAEVFKKVHIPRSLIEITDPLDHQETIDTDDVFFYKSVTGINENLTGSTNIPYGLTEEELQELTASIPVREDSEEGTTPSSEQQDPLSQLDKKERKKLVKEQNREKRQHKTPKKVKKQLNK
ncbi:tentative rio kinase, partial [Naegleria gruberi]